MSTKYTAKQTDEGVWMDRISGLSVARLIAGEAMVALGFQPQDWRKRDTVIMAIFARVNGTLDAVAGMREAADAADRTGGIGWRTCEPDRDRFFIMSEQEEQADEADARQTHVFMVTQ